MLTSRGGSARDSLGCTNRCSPPAALTYVIGQIKADLTNTKVQCTPDIVATFIVSDIVSWYKIHLFYYIQVGYIGKSDIVARNWCPKVATISKVYYIIYITILGAVVQGELLFGCIYNVLYSIMSISFKDNIF